MLTRNLHYDLIVVGYPMPELDPAGLLATIRSPDSASQETPVLVLAEEEDLPDLSTLVPASRTRAIDAGSHPDEMARTVASLLGIAARAPTRLLVQIQARTGTRTGQRIVQTENISESGMLLRTRERVDVGTELDLEFSLPGDPRPIRGRAVVVRHAVAEVEPAVGFAIRFLQLAPGSAKRLRRHVERANRGFGAA